MATIPSFKGTVNWLPAVVAGVVSAGIYTVSMANLGSLLFFLIYIAALPLCMAALSLGRTGTLLAVIVGAFLSFVGTKAPGLGALYVVLFALPIGLLGAMANRSRTNEQGVVFWYPEGPLLTAVIAYPAALFLAICAYTYATGVDGGLLGLSLQTLEKTIEGMTLQFKLVSAQMSAEEAANFTTGMAQISAYLPKIAQILPSIFCVTWIALVIVNALFAQFLLKQKNWLGRAPLRLVAIDLSPYYLGVTAVFCAMTYLAPAPFDYIGLNLASLASIPLLLIGMAVVHVWAATTRFETAILVVFYLVLAIFFWLGILLAVLGAVDQLFHIRQRLAQLPQQH